MLSCVRATTKVLQLLLWRSSGLESMRNRSSLWKPASLMTSLMADSRMEASKRGWT